ncbi:MAG: hypothetical protein ACYCOO_01535 [Chitinophagaceae bacterium]
MDDLPNRNLGPWDRVDRCSLIMGRDIAISKFQKLKSRTWQKENFVVGVLWQKFQLRIQLVPYLREPKKRII